jgi:hypothetical protein
MKRQRVVSAAMVAGFVSVSMVMPLAQTQAPAPAPAPLTCSSKATASDNNVPAALAKDGFTALFNGKDLTGWQALIDIGTLKFGAGLNSADLLKLSPSEKAARQKDVEKGGQNLQTVKEYGDIDHPADHWNTFHIIAVERQRRRSVRADPAGHADDNAQP